MELHPDRNPGKDTTSDFQALQEAYTVLSNENLRKKYDAQTSVSPIKNNQGKRGKKNSSERSSSKPSETTVSSSGKKSNKPTYFRFFMLFGFSGWIFVMGHNQYIVAQEKEKVRLEQQGIERARAAAVLAQQAAIAAQQAADLKRLERPLPPNGVYRTADFRKFDLSNSPPLKIANAPGANTLMKLIRITDGVEIMSLFIGAGQTVEVAVPLGTYKAKIASGQTWYGDAMRFGPDTTYAILDAELKFFIDKNQLVGNSLMLTHVMNGNLREIRLNASDF